MPGFSFSEELEEFLFEHNGNAEVERFCIFFGFFGALAHDEEVGLYGYFMSDFAAHFLYHVFDFVLGVDGIGELAGDNENLDFVLVEEGTCGGRWLLSGSFR